MDRQIAFYQNVLGFKLHWREGATAGLGAGTADLLRLTELPGARRVRRRTGLYHFAVLLPTRRELARAVARLFSLRYPNAPTDHVITETTYLSDPEDNGIEIYADTPEDGSWTSADGVVVVRDAHGVRRSGRDPLDVERLLNELTPSDRLDHPMPEGTKIGHVHLHVADLTDAMRFYHALLGFGNQGLLPTMGMGMVSAGGYHHHIGFNIWAGEGAPPPPPDALGLRYFTVVLPNRAALERVADQVREAGIAAEQRPEGTLIHDPSRNGVLLTARPELEGDPGRLG
ncbi:MAG: VOC family protein [Armatimonadetes bacterium]|nr:VOC family protein [Armatimonadota bacterium]